MSAVVVPGGANQTSTQALHTSHVISSWSGFYGILAQEASEFGEAPVTCVLEVLPVPGGSGKPSY
jgi:hypothetical protein